MTRKTRKTDQTSTPTETPEVTSQETVETTEAPIETTTTETAPAAQPEGETLVIAEPTPKKKEAAKKPEKPAKEFKGMMVSLKGLVFSDPKLSADDLVTLLGREGFSPSKSSAATIRADFIHSCRVLDSLGVKGLKHLLPK